MIAFQGCETYISEWLYTAYLENHCAPRLDRRKSIPWCFYSMLIVRKVNISWFGGFKLQNERWTICVFRHFQLLESFIINETRKGVRYLLSKRVYNCFSHLFTNRQKIEILKKFPLLVNPGNQTSITSPDHWTKLYIIWATEME